MPIEFEPIQWKSKCGEFVVTAIYDGKNVMQWQVKDYSLSRPLTWVSPLCPTFSAAVAWCEERAKQEQGGGE